MADETKAEGDAFPYRKAIRYFTEAIKISPANHVLYSSRSLTYSFLNDFSNSLSDALKTVELKPDWSKGYSRLAEVYFCSHRYEDAVFAYEKGLQIDPNNVDLKTGFATAVAALARSRPAPKASNPFGDVISKKRADFEVQEVCPEKESEPESVEAPYEEKELSRVTNLQAQKEKEAGNVAYMKKDFDTAINHYTKALELDDEDISFLTNRAAVYLEIGKYDECIKDCDKAVERGREVQSSDFKMTASALRSASMKLAKCSKDYETAIGTFQQTLTELRYPDTLKMLNDDEKAKRRRRI